MTTYYKTVGISLSDINILGAFAYTPPKPDKIKSCYEYYTKTGRFDRSIIVDENNVLRDGYVAYLIARMMGLSNIKVVKAIEREQAKIL
ncbi:MAG: hypothetical protein WDA65_08720 [Christensenellales bacterium]